MKKLIVGLLAAFLMTTGLVAFSGSPASAAECPYQGCVPTGTVGVAVPKKNKPVVRVRAKVVALGSNAKPSGKAFLSVYKIKPNGNVKLVARVRSTLNDKGKTRFQVRGLNKGKYKYTVEYKNNQAAGFEDSSGGGRFRIKRR